MKMGRIKKCVATYSWYQTVQLKSISLHFGQFNKMTNKYLLLALTVYANTTVPNPSVHLMKPK